MKLTVHAEVFGGAVLQQVFVVEYTVSHQMCDDCHRSEAQDYWRAVVSVVDKFRKLVHVYYFLSTKSSIPYCICHRLQVQYILFFEVACLATFFCLKG